ncbi:MAG: cobalt transporter CbiM [Synergistaceae bacterium]|nr:cobalt transporter CbiM [Synergistaceae bacterium]
MHISEGILTNGILIAGWAGTLTGISIGLKKTNPDKIVKTALVSSAFFLASLVNIKIGVSSTHLSLIAPTGLLLGYSTFPAVFTALLLQSLLFHFGGIFVLGANTFTMGFSALMTYIIFGKLIFNSNNRKTVAVISFFAGSLAVIFAAFLTGLILYFSDKNFINAVKILFLAHVPVALIEGLVTSFLILWLKKVSPEFLL